MTNTTKYGHFEKQFMSQRGMLLTGDELDGFDTMFKFGHNPAVGTSFTCISPGGICRLPPPSGATTLRVKAGGDAADTAGGAGARSVLLQGLDATGSVIQEVLALAGILASASTSQSFMRLYRVIVLETGVYPESFTTGGAIADIVIENTAGTEDWLTVTVNGIADCQSQVAYFCVGKGQRAYLSSVNMFVDSNKAVDLLLIVRQNFMDVTSPITPMRVGSTIAGVEGHVDIPFTEPPRFAEFTDVAMVAKVSTGTAAVSVQMSFILNSKLPAT
jgi:hypothetical protein